MKLLHLTPPLGITGGTAVVIVSLFANVSESTTWNPITMLLGLAIMIASLLAAKEMNEWEEEE